MKTPSPEYMLFFRGSNWYENLSPEEIQNTLSKFKAWFDRLNEQGKLKGGHPLGHEGKIVSGLNGRTVADGPFAESKETIGGYFILTVHTLEEAVAIAKQSPILEFGGSIEVRPIAEVCPMMEQSQQGFSKQELAHAGV